MLMLDLPILPITDFSTLSINDKVVIEIVNTTHQFSPDASFSGVDIKLQPIFGSNLYINGSLIVSNSFGLPALIFQKGSRPLIDFSNNTKFTTNIHYHGLDSTGNVDGVSALEIFGISTTLGTNVPFQLPIIQNNSSLLWYHAHPAFRSVQLAYAGIAGALIITDSISKPLNDLFTYGGNYFVLACQDMDLDSSGSGLPESMAKVSINEPLTDDQIIIGVMQIFQEITGAQLDFGDFDKRFTEDLGIDSLALVEGMMACEDMFDISISNQEAFTLVTSSQVVVFVAMKRSQS